MKILLDTHTLLWALEEPTKIHGAAFAILQDVLTERCLSAATIWELAIKFGQGKIRLTMPYTQWLNTAVQDLKLFILPITIEYAERQSQLPNFHKDPFDRLIIAQALVDGIPIATADEAFDAYGVTRIW